MPHIDENKRGIDRVSPDLGPFEIDENLAWVWRTTWGSRPWSRPLSARERSVRARRLHPGSPEERNLFAGYHVTHEGWGAFVPLLMNHVGVVPLEMREEDVVPVLVNLANAQQVLLNFRCEAGVGELEWNEYEATPEEAEANGYREEAKYARDNRLAMARIIDPVTPFSGAENVLVTDEAIIRAALRVRNTIWYHISLTLTSAINQATRTLGAAATEPLALMEWLRSSPPAEMVEQLPLDGQRSTIEAEICEQITYMACRDLRYFGLVVRKVRLENMEISEALTQAAELEQVAKRTARAAVHLGEAAGQLMERGGLGTMPDNPQIGDRWAQAQAFQATLRSLDARAGIDSRAAPFVQVGDIAIGGSAGGSKAPGGKPGGSGAPRKRR